VKQIRSNHCTSCETRALICLIRGYPAAKISQQHQHQQVQCAPAMCDTNIVAYRGPLPCPPQGKAQQKRRADHALMERLSHLHLRALALVVHADGRRL